MVLSKTDTSFNTRIDEAYLEEWTLLEFALMLGHWQCAEVLLRSGATIDVECEYRTALYLYFSSLFHF